MDWLLIAIERFRQILAVSCKLKRVHGTVREAIMPVSQVCVVLVHCHRFWREAASDPRRIDRTYANVSNDIKAIYIDGGTYELVCEAVHPDQCVYASTTACGRFPHVRATSVIHGSAADTRLFRRAAWCMVFVLSSPNRKNDRREWAARWAPPARKKPRKGRRKSTRIWEPMGNGPLVRSSSSCLVISSFLFVSCTFSPLEDRHVVVPPSLCFTSFTVLGWKYSMLSRRRCTRRFDNSL